MSDKYLLFLTDFLEVRWFAAHPARIVSWARMQEQGNHPTTPTLLLCRRLFKRQPL
jgi:hypothetical protein